MTAGVSIHANELVQTGGGVLYDPLYLNAPTAAIFDPTHWDQSNRLIGPAGGRGAAWFVAPEEPDDDQWVLRHYRRGGAMARLSKDRFWYRGVQRVRSFAEWRLTADLYRAGLPVPRPVAASFRRHGPFYSADIITVLIAGTRPLGALFPTLCDPAWRTIGATIARFHQAGVDHSDLNANNILIDDRQSVWLIDFDKCSRREPGPWARGNISRLQRSLRKLGDAHDLAVPHTGWQALLDGYAANMGASESG